MEEIISEESDIQEEPKKEERKQKKREIERDLRYWVYRGLGIGGGVIAIITIFLPWFQITGGSIFTITPLYINYNGLFMYFWDYSVAMTLDYGFIAILIMMDMSFALIIISTILCSLTLSRKPSSMIMIIICLTFLTFGISVMMMSLIPGQFPFFGVSGSVTWGFSIGWFLLFPAMFFMLFFRKLVITEKEEFHQEWKQKIKEMQD